MRRDRKQSERQGLVWLLGNGTGDVNSAGEVSSAGGVQWNGVAVSGRCGASGRTGGAVAGEVAGIDAIAAGRACWDVKYRPFRINGLYKDTVSTARRTPSDPGAVPTAASRLFGTGGQADGSGPEN
jgi:hypothetical protein